MATQETYYSLDFGVLNLSSHMPNLQLVQHQSVIAYSCQVPTMAHRI